LFREEAALGLLRVQEATLMSRPYMTWLANPSNQKGAASFTN